MTRGRAPLQSLGFDCNGVATPVRDACLLQGQPDADCCGSIASTGCGQGCVKKMGGVCYNGDGGPWYSTCCVRTAPPAPVYRPATSPVRYQYECPAAPASYKSVCMELKFGSWQPQPDRDCCGFPKDTFCDRGYDKVLGGICYDGDSLGPRYSTCCCARSGPPAIAPDMCSSGGGMPGLSLHLQNTQVYEVNGHVVVPFSAQCGGQPYIGGFEPACNNQPQGYTLVDGEQVVSTDEAKWCIVPTPRPCEHLVYVLVDLSNSISGFSKSTDCGRDGCIGVIRESLRRFISTLQANDGGGDRMRYEIKISAFDGRAGTQTLQDWTMDYPTTFTAIETLRCEDPRFCQDPSTNLYGAVITAAQELSLRAQGKNVREAYLVFYTDGTDQAARRTETDAEWALRVPVTPPPQSMPILARIVTHSVGVRGEDRNGNDGYHMRMLQKLASQRDNVHLAIPNNMAETLPAAFVSAASMIEIYSKSHYELRYCTPRRSGHNRLKLRMTGGWDLPLGSYNADGIGAIPTGVNHLRDCSAELEMICKCRELACPAPCLHPASMRAVGPVWKGNSGDDLWGDACFPQYGPVMAAGVYRQLTWSQPEQLARQDDTDCGCKTNLGVGQLAVCAVALGIVNLLICGAIAHLRSKHQQLGKSIEGLQLPGGESPKGAQYMGH